MTFIQYESKIIPKFKTVQENPYNKTFSNTSLTYRNLLDHVNKNSKYYFQIWLVNASSNNLVKDSNNKNEIEYWYAVPNERYGLNVLGLVMFSLIFGIIISKMKKNGIILVEFFESVNEAFSKLIEIVML